MAIPMERVVDRILSIRGHRVMLDADLADLYGVPTKRLNEAVRRNAARFPEDFMFQLTVDEAVFFEVAICDLKCTRGMPVYSVRLYRAGRGDALLRPEQ